jgi:hypothetical protein
MFFSNKNLSFLIIGAQKAATSSLYTYLVKHPNILPAKTKEVNYFNIDSNYSKGNTWYKQQFTQYINPFKKHLSFEATPEYLYMPYAPERIYKYNPKIKLIVVLREPVERAYSAWNMFKKLHKLNKVPSVIEKGYIEHADNNLRKVLFASEFPSFEDCINLEMKYIQDKANFLEPSFVRRGLYAQQIERYFQFFSKEQFLFLDYSDFEGNLNKVLLQTTQFLEIEPLKMNVNNYQVANKGVYDLEKPLIFSELHNYYKPYNDKLNNLINVPFDWNNKNI